MSRKEQGRGGQKRRSGRPRSRRRGPRTSWDPLAAWYDGWVGKGGSKHHREVAIPAVMELLNLKKGERVLDLGAGQGVLCPPVRDAGASYTGVDLSKKLIQMGRQHHGKKGLFLVGDAGDLPALDQLTPESFDAVVFLLSIQDMDPLDAALRSAQWALREGGRVVLLMTHPCFRVPRQSGWGWDDGRKLQYRRVDRYLTPLPVPLKAYPGARKGTSTSFHRPLQDYVNGLSACGIFVDQMRELPTYKKARPSPRSSAINRAQAEFPLFLGLRGVKQVSGAGSSSEDPLSG